MFDNQSTTQSSAAQAYGRQQQGPDPKTLNTLIAEGLSDQRCGERFGLSKYAIRRLRRRWGISAQLNKPRAESEAVDLKGFRWRSGNLPEELIGSLYGRSGYRFFKRRPPP